MSPNDTGEPEGRRPWERTAGGGPPGPGGPPPPPHGDSSWHTTRSVPSIVVVVLIVIWTVLAVQWKEKDCALVPTSYLLVITHGTPSVFEGCGDHAVDVTDD
ncbi:hypothetical protein [Streptomyces tendae]|uniref:hypothetical protein n=1 Tax=Streptomyces tendae TaxID=1932 RepID=UPI003693D8F4